MDTRIKAIENNKSNIIRYSAELNNAVTTNHKNIIMRNIETAKANIDRLEKMTDSLHASEQAESIKACGQMTY